MAQAVIEGIVILTEIVEEKDGQFASYCRELGTASCGDTIEEAFANLEEAIKVHGAALNEAGELGRFFRERNINIHDVPPEDLYLTVPYNTPFKTLQQPVSVSLPG
jgi:predicted RNase H-like HicB family nuclease